MVNITDAIVGMFTRVNDALSFRFDFRLGQWESHFDLWEVIILFFVVYYCFFVFFKEMD